MENYLSSYIDMSKADPHKFNLITAGCGTGKSYFATHMLTDYFPDLLRSQFLLVTSRSLTAQQQAMNEGMDLYSHLDLARVNYMNGRGDMDDNLAAAFLNAGMTVMTYDKVPHILTWCGDSECSNLENAKVVVIDECHCLFSDMFIKNIDLIKFWVQQLVKERDDVYVFGLTATPDILEFYRKSWGVNINYMLDEPLFRHKAKQLTVTDATTLPYFVNQSFEGKTLIMCPTVQMCMDLQKQIPNSAVLVSRSNQSYTEEMQRIRDYIAKYERFPDKHKIEYDDGSSRWVDLDVLIGTSTIREGFNLCPESGVKNIVSCYTDSLHVIQIAGRARYDLDNLVVVDCPVRENLNKAGNFLKTSRKQFLEYLEDKRSFAWFDSISNVVQHGIDDVVRYREASDVDGFINYIKGRWAIPANVPDEGLSSYWIWAAEDKAEVVAEYKRRRMSALPARKITFVRILHEMQERLGFNVVEDRGYVDGKRIRYKAVVGFNEAAVTYEPAYPQYS